MKRWCCSTAGLTHSPCNDLIFGLGENVADERNQNLDRDQDGENEGLNALLELREFIATELDPIGSHNQLDRALKPLTDGLGLESPLISSAPKPAEPKKETNTRSAISPQVYEEDAPPAKENALANVIARDQVEETEVRAESVVETHLEAAPSVVTPPPLPTKASSFRRIMAGLLDELFVLSLFVISFAMTLKVLTGGTSLTVETVKSVEGAVLIRFALLEYATLWLAYLSIGLGVLDSTFGMWVWGLRLGYPRESLGSVLSKKGIRIVLSFLFFATIAPVILLIFRSKGRNLIDLLSGTSVYRSLGE